MKETDIRPQAIFDEYLRLCAEDTRTYFESAQRTAIPCPACGAEGTPAFVKNGFTYELCASCGSLYVNPRPSAQSFSSYYQTAPSSRFWASTFYRETAEARRRLLWQPKARSLAQKLADLDAYSHTIVDIGGGYGLFAEEIAALLPGGVVVIEPAPHLAEVCRGKSLTVVEKFLEDVQVTDLPPGGKVFVSFELFEHLHSPATFLGHLRELMQPADLFAFTTLSGAGLDIQVLWEHSKSVSPPHHLNFLNPQSVAILLERVGLELLEVTTPGKLDLDILCNNQEHIQDRFWRRFTATVTDEVKERWQSLIAASGCSSHMMVICRKPQRHCSGALEAHAPD